MRYSYLHTQDSLTVVIEGKPYVISSGHSGFADIRDAVLAGRDPVQVLGIIQAKADVLKNMIETTLRKQHLTGALTYEEGLVYYNGQALYNYAAERLIELLELGHDVDALAKFIDKQQRNPDSTVHEHLYKFLEFGKIPLTPDGDFLAYKAVRADYKDIHSGTLLNSKGARPSVPREAVDPDRNRTCSSGLHVCSYGYLPHFAHSNGHVMVCKVNPTDVVAIPADYNNTKMRVSTYEVVGEVTSYYERGENILSECLLASEAYSVMYDDGTGADEYDTFYTFDEAVAQANSLKVAEPGSEVWVDNNVKEEEVYRAA